ncbi:MAG: VWA domain-containing protein [Deltaproteobacteria bacterium]|jgi:magnesium chelatase subunit D|nr:VWA domain-containing protein [Deltaproteobacteria bacterium]
MVDGDIKRAPRAGATEKSSGGYPLAALVGQADMARALILLAVDADLGGLLLVGEKGTAKSTAARALAEILPAFDGRLDCPYHCRPDLAAEICPSCAQTPGPVGEVRAPFKTVPLGVTEERLLGGLDWEATLRAGRPTLKPGLLGEANHGLVYVDEVNLLAPSLAHLLLDAVSGGRVTVERDGLSLWHPAKVALLGSMNPEEGPLGPQLADRFALSVTLKGESDPAVRAEIVRRRLAYERDPAAFRAAWARESQGLTLRIKRAREILARLVPSPGASRLAARLAQSVKAAGHRADLALCRAALALAAWEMAAEPEYLGVLGLSGLSGPSGPPQGFEVGPERIREVSHLVLPTRERPDRARREKTFVGQVKKVENLSEIRGQEVYLTGRPEIPPEFKPESLSAEDRTALTVYEVAQTFDVVSPKTREAPGPKERSGRRGWRETAKARGRAFKTTARRLGRPVSLSATLRAAAPFQALRRQRLGDDDMGRVGDRTGDRAGDREAGRALLLNPNDFREKVYRHKTGRLVLFVVDSSGSIGTLYRMEEAKAAAMSLLADAYRKRDRVALIAFYGQAAELLLPPTNSPDLAGRLLASLPSGGKTPLAAALAMAHRLIAVERSKDPKITPHVILMTDGRPNVPLDPARSPWPEVLAMAGRMADDPTVKFLLIDTDRGAYNDYKLTRELAERLRCPRMSLEELRRGSLEGWLGGD